MRMIVMAALTLLAGAATAQPMWEQAALWRCELDRHLLAAPGRAVADMDPQRRYYMIDFEAGIVTSAFISGQAPIVERAFYASEFGNHNVLVPEWDTGRYPFIILEEDSGFWEINGSGAGSADGEAWIALYECRPQG